MNLFDHYYVNKSAAISKFNLKTNIVNRKAIFIDRDGILIKDVNHIKSSDQVKLCKNVQEFLEHAKLNKFNIVVVTNQSSVSRGIINFSEYVKLTEKFLSYLPINLYPDNIFTSFHLPGNQSGLENFNWRKPGIGMFEYALNKYNFNLNDSIMIGDKLSDLIPAHECKVGNLIYIKSDIHADEINKVKEWNDKSINKIKIMDQLDFFKVIS